MHLIIGLGNPGEKYKNTRHNAGFMALDRLAKKHGFDSPGKFGKSLISKGRIERRPVVLAWPQTYMNLSGQAAAELASFYKTPGDEILVVHDEMDLAPGLIKLSFGGGPAGHNGLISLIELLPGDFARLKVGIGRPVKTAFTQGNVDHVLSPFSSLEEEAINAGLGEAALAAEMWLLEGLAAAQGRFNQRR